VFCVDSAAQPKDHVPILLPVNSQHAFLAVPECTSSPKRKLLK
jgi:hypothetical protein